MLHYVQTLAWPVAVVAVSSNLRRAVAAVALAKYARADEATGEVYGSPEEGQHGLD